MMRLIRMVLLSALLITLFGMTGRAQQPCINQYPTALNTRSTLCDAGDVATTTLSTGITSGSTSLTVGQTAAFSPTGTLVIGSEQLVYSAKTSTTFTISLRGAHGTAAVAHSSGASVRGAFVAQMIKVQSDAQVALETKIGRGAGTPLAGKIFSSLADGVSGWHTPLELGLVSAAPSDVAYDASTWNANLDAPTKNAVRDKFEALVNGTIINATNNVIPYRLNATTFADSPLTVLDANTMEQRNGATGQTFRLYNTYTDASNYERGFMRWVSNRFEIGSGAAGTGTPRNTRIINAGSLTGSIEFADDAGNVRGTIDMAGGLFTSPTGVSSGSSSTGLYWASGLDFFGTQGIKWRDGNFGSFDTVISRAAPSVLSFNDAGTGGTALQLKPKASTPGDPSSSSEVNYYIKGGKVVFQFNDAGTVRYKTLDLAGTGVTWVASTTAP